MKQARALQTVAVFCLVSILPLSLFADMKLKVKVINNGQQPVNGSLSYTAGLHEIVGLEISAFYRNTSGVDSRTAILRGTGVDDLLNHWQTMRYTLAPGETVLLSDTLYFRITSAKSLSMSFRTEQRNPDASIAPGETIYPVNVTISVDTATASFPLPVMMPDMLRFSDDFSDTRYSAGTATSFQWKPAHIGGDIIRIRQDAYRFELDNPQNLQKAVSGVYKSADDSVETARFYGLREGCTYGYYIKADYETADDTYTLYSDIWYSTQDNSPPEPVTITYAGLSSLHTAHIEWPSVPDVSVRGTASDVAFYVVYRTLDTGSDMIVDTVQATHQGGIYTWDDSEVIAGMYYHYKIRAVDNVGNIGNGYVSNDLYYAGDENSGDGGTGSGPFSELSGVADAACFKGTVDTLSFDPEDWVEKMQFVVVREDTSFYTHPPAIPMCYFASDSLDPDEFAVDPAHPSRKMWIVDYAWNEEKSDSIDPEFVDGFVYHRRVYMKDNRGVWQFQDLDSRKRDCIAPADIKNLQVHSELISSDDHPGTAPFTRWQTVVTWDTTSDGASGVKQYQVYRKIAGLDSDFLAIGGALSRNIFVDPDSHISGAAANTPVNYKVVAEDFTGNRLPVSQASWSESDRTLKAPGIRFYGEAVKNYDTLYLPSRNVSVVPIELFNFVYDGAEAFIVSVNGSDVEIPLSAATVTGKGTVVIGAPLDDHNISEISVRVLYPGRRSSVWTDAKYVTFRNIAPSGLEAVTTPSAGYDEWDGHIYLTWKRNSLDNIGYEVFRSEDRSSWNAVAAAIESELDTVAWTDFYGIDELSGTADDTLVTYRYYYYKVRMNAEFNQTSDFSEIDSAYCAHPPVITSAGLDTLNDEPAITIQWERSFPMDYAQNSWKTRIFVYQDDENTLIDSTGIAARPDVNNGLTFIYQPIESGHNYIFRLYEMVLDDNGSTVIRKSALSAPKTVSLLSLTSLNAVTQPKGSIYLSWAGDPLLTQLPVDSIRIERFRNDQNQAESVYMLGSSRHICIDSVNLVDQELYSYRVSLLSVNKEILAFGIVSAYCDTGNAYIPDFVQYDARYFNSRLLDVKWDWKARANLAHPPAFAAEAKELRIQAGAIPTFSSPDPGDTTDTGWFPVDSTQLHRVIRVPENVNSNNDKLYLRITARDRYMQPDSGSDRDIVWSDSTVCIVYDIWRPNAVNTIQIDSLRAYYRSADMVTARLRWNEGSTVDDMTTTANVVGYMIKRTQGNDTLTAGYVPAEDNRHSYMFIDTLQNRTTSWYITSIDAAGNVSSGIGNVYDDFVPTPSAPVPDPEDRKICSWDSVSSPGTVYYSVEAAMSARHFIWGYENSVDSTLLYQSGWIAGRSYIITGGWGSIFSDTTFYRVKAQKRDNLNESGWSVIAYKINVLNEEDEHPAHPAGAGVPEEFQLYQNYPNPFNAGTVIAFDLPVSADVDIYIYNLQGKRIRRLLSDVEAPGIHRIHWNGDDDFGNSVASGLYIAVVDMSDRDSGRHMERKIKMTVVR